MDGCEKSSWGGSRKGAGRKPRRDRLGFVAHTPRPVHDHEHPVHVTVRALRAPSLRSQRVMTALRAVFARASKKGFRLLHYSVQGNHLHLVVEADDRVTLWRGMQRLLSRAALAVNEIAKRSGKLWRDRYHRRDLTTPRAVRSAFVYVLFNVRKHELFDSDRVELFTALDPFSSAAWFDPRGWSPRARPPALQIARAGPSIVAEPTSWLARTGWKRSRLGLLCAGEHPRLG